jgi:uncharacterized protein YbjT (DUF2867 family)
MPVDCWVALRMLVPPVCHDRFSGSSAPQLLSRYVSIVFLRLRHRRPEAGAASGSRIGHDFGGKMSQNMVHRSDAIPGMETQQVLVLGATGSIGRRLVARLRAEGHQLKAASRSSQVRFDWTDATTWPAALTDVTRVFVMAPDGVGVSPAFIRQAVDRGVTRLVLLSSKAIEAMGDERLLAAEETVRSAGVEWTVVRPDWFNQNFDEGVLREAVLGGEVALPLGDAKQAFNDADDIAAVAAAALTGSGHAGHTYELSGPEALSFEEATAVVSQASGRPVRYLGKAEDYLRVMTGFGLPREQVLREVAAFEALRAAGDAQLTDVVARVTGRAPKPFRVYAEQAAARGAWAQ